MSIKLKGSTDGSVTLQAPADTSPTGTDKTLILPTGVGSANQVLRNGSTAGTLEFANGGKILQVQSTLKTNGFSSESTSFVDITGLSVSITPSSSSSKILVFSNFVASGNTWPSGYGPVFNLVRGSTNLAVGTSGSNFNGSAGYNGWSNNEGNTRGNHSSVVIHFLDSPNTTSATTYKIQGKHTYTTGTYTFTVGRIEANAYMGFGSVITAMEVAA